MSYKLYYTFALILLLGCKKDNVIGGGVEPTATENIVSVTENGISNDGSLIGPEINELVRKSYGKTLYFPAGVYNLTEPIILPLDYTKNVNIIFDNNAYVKSDSQLEALLKVGFSELTITDRSHRRFSYIEGGIFDCYNADNGIYVNGLKQLVSLKNMSLVRGRDTHIRIGVAHDFEGRGTSSSDTKIDNITIQGMSSNDEIYGIYIDGLCHDNKISNTFIYGTKYAIATKSAGHILNNVHILSKSSTGGTDLGSENNFRSTEGIRIASGGFFVFNQVYYDTVDKGIVVIDDYNPTLLLDQNISYSYLGNFGTSFVYRDNTSTAPLQIKISNSVITASNKGFKIFDINPSIIGYDVSEFYTFVNSTIDNPHLLDPYDASLLQKARKTTSDALVFTNLNQFDADWHVLGALVESPYRSLLRVDLTDEQAIELDMKFENGALKLIEGSIIDPSNTLSLQFGYIIKDGYCLLLFKPSIEATFYPVVNDILGNGSFMITPSKDRHYRLIDYDISESPTLLLEK